MNDDERIDEICEHVGRAETRNALHACREGHPLGKDNAFKWRNAWWLLARHSIELAFVDTSWLRRRAIEEESASKAFITVSTAGIV